MLVLRQRVLTPCCSFYYRRCFSFIHSLKITAVASIIILEQIQLTAQQRVSLSAIKSICFLFANSMPFNYNFKLQRLKHSGN